MVFSPSLDVSDVLLESLQTQEEMAEMENDIRGLDADLQAKTASLKLAHTRLETRTQRSGVDLCRDQVSVSLMSFSHFQSLN